MNMKKRIIQTRPRKVGKTTERIEKLETTVRAGLALRRSIEPMPKPPLNFKALFVPIKAVETYDAIIEELAQT